MTTTMNYGGYVSPSTVDWFGESTGVLFFRGCSLKCKDCQNPGLLVGEEPISLDAIKEMIDESRFIISGVVFSGGEPCQQIKPLLNLINWCKKHDLHTYLHTSGAYPKELKCVIDQLDGVRIDFKPAEQFSKRTARTVKFARYSEKFTESVINVLDPSGIPYWVTAVALRNNGNLSELYNLLDFKPKRVLIVQGNEECPKTVDEMKREFHNCYLYTREEGLKWNE